MAGQKGTVFGVDKYKEPKLLDMKDTVANAIIDACFMVPGNLPSLPHVGVNIRQYFYKEETSISSDKIKKDLEACCGRTISGATIGKVDFSVQRTNNNDYVFLLILVVSFSPGEEELLGITMKPDKDNYVHFNFDYVPIK